MKKFLIVFGWVSSSILTLTVSATTIHFLKKAQIVQYASYPGHPLSNQRVLSYESPRAESGISTQIDTQDARPILIAQFLEKYQSPLKPYDYWGQFLTQLADKYGLDYRLLPSIAMQESNLCKKIPEGTFNCLGLGIHSKGTWGFESFEANFDKAAEVLRKNYINQGLITPDEIQNKYTPGSNGSWEFAVNSFMEKLEYADF